MYDKRRGGIRYGVRVVCRLVHDIMHRLLIDCIDCTASVRDVIMSLIRRQMEVKDAQFHALRKSPSE